MMASEPQILLPGSSPDEMFPVLNAEQQARVLAHGRARKVAAGEALVEHYQQPTKIFVVITGKLELFRTSDENEEIVAVFVVEPTLIAEEMHPGTAMPFAAESLPAAITVATPIARSVSIAGFKG